MGIFDGVLGEVAGGVLGLFGGESQNASNAEQAAANREWQEQMSNTAHRREVRDLRAAGLNPILSGLGGKGASTPGGAQANMVNTVSSALEGRQAVLEARNTAQTNRNLRAQEENTDADTNLKKNDTDLKSYQIKLLDQQQKTEEQATRRERYQADITQNSAKGAAIEGQIDSTTWGKVLRYINRANPLGNTSSAFGNMLKR